MTTRRDKNLTDVLSGVVTQDPRLWVDVYYELREMRALKSEAGSHKLAHFPALVSLTGYKDHDDAWAWLIDTVKSFTARSKSLDAAINTIFGHGYTVQDRLVNTANRLGDIETTDPRSARRWSDDGLPTLVTLLVDRRYMTSADANPGISVVEASFLERTHQGASNYMVSLCWTRHKAAIREQDRLRWLLEVDQMDGRKSVNGLVAPEWHDCQPEGFVRCTFHFDLPVELDAWTLQLIFPHVAPPFFNVWNNLEWRGSRTQITTHREMFSIQWRPDTELRETFIEEMTPSAGSIDLPQAFAEHFGTTSEA